MVSLKYDQATVFPGKITALVVYLRSHIKPVCHSSTWLLVLHVPFFHVVVVFATCKWITITKKSAFWFKSWAQTISCGQGYT